MHQFDSMEHTEDRKCSGRIRHCLHLDITFNKVFLKEFLLSVGVENYESTSWRVTHTCLLRNSKNLSYFSCKQATMEAEEKLYISEPSMISKAYVPLYSFLSEILLLSIHH